MNDYTLYVLDQENIEDDGFELNYDNVSVEEIREHSIEFYQDKTFVELITFLCKLLSEDLFGGKYFYVVDNNTNEVIR